MEKIKTKIINVNLQQGVLIDDSSENSYSTVVGAFCRHTKVIYPKTPIVGNDLLIPDELSEFTIKNKFTDSFSLNMWTYNGSVDVR